MAIGFRVSEDAAAVTIVRGCAVGLDGDGGTWFPYDGSLSADVVAPCRADR